MTITETEAAEVRAAIASTLPAGATATLTSTSGESATIAGDEPAAPEPDIALLTIEVDARKLTNALRAALPHVAADTENIALHRVQIHTAGPQLHVVTTDALTCIVAAVDLDEACEELTAFDMLPGDAKTVVGLFKPSKDQVSTLRIDVSTRHITVTETALFDGRSLRVLRPPTSQAEGSHGPNVRGLVGRWLAAEAHARDLTVVTADLWRRFAVSAAVYDGVLAVESRAGARGPLVITCRERFAGLLMPHRMEDGEDPVREDRDAWLNRLPAVVDLDEQVAS